MEEEHGAGTRSSIESKIRSRCMVISLVRKNHNARRLYRKRVIGTVEDYPDEVTVRQAASGLLSDVNLRIRHDRNVCISIDQLWSIATQKTYRGYIRRWIRSRWGSRSLDEIKAVEVEAWLRGLNLARARGLRDSQCLFGHI